MRGFQTSTVVAARVLTDWRLLGLSLAELSKIDKPQFAYLANCTPLRCGGIVDAWREICKIVRQFGVESTGSL